MVVIGIAGMFPCSVHTLLAIVCGCCCMNVVVYMFTEALP